MTTKDRLVASKLRHMSDNNEDVMTRLIDIAREVERNDGVSEREKGMIEDLKMECEDIAELLGGLVEYINRRTA